MCKIWGMHSWSFSCMCAHADDHVCMLIVLWSVGRWCRSVLFRMTRSTLHVEICSIYCAWISSRGDFLLRIVRSHDSLEFFRFSTSFLYAVPCSSFLHQIHMTWPWFLMHACSAVAEFQQTCMHVIMLWPILVCDMLVCYIHDRKLRWRRRRRKIRTMSQGFVLCLVSCPSIMCLLQVMIMSVNNKQLLMHLIQCLIVVCGLYPDVLQHQLMIIMFSMTTT